MYLEDDWPKMPDGTDFDGKQLLCLIRSGKSPFAWDVNLLVREIEEKLGTEVVDIPFMYSGSNNYVSSPNVHLGYQLTGWMAQGFPPQVVKSTGHLGAFSP